MLLRACRFSVTKMSAKTHQVSKTIKRNRYYQKQSVFKTTNRHYTTQTLSRNARNSFSWGLSAIAASAVLGTFLFFSSSDSDKQTSAESERGSSEVSNEKWNATKTYHHHMGSDAPIYRVVLTGGPCGGKSTALAQVDKYLSGLGFNVFAVPEAATLLFKGGAKVDFSDSEQLTGFQTQLMKTQMALEDRFYQLAKLTGEPSVIICDRGVMDNSAYMPGNLWLHVLDDNDWTVVALRDKRYDAVIHLVTAADGAEKFYTTANNSVRTETPAQARALDKKLRQAWIGHSNLTVADNRSDFADKMQRVVSSICQIIGAPLPVGDSQERRFLIKELPEDCPIKMQKFDIEQRYLRSPGGNEARIMQRKQKGNATYSYSVKTTEGNEQVIIERHISGREYSALCQQTDPKTQVIKKKEYCFLWENEAYTLNVYSEPKQCIVLEENSEGPSNLPPFLDVEKEVTKDVAYTGYHMAKNDK